MDLTQLIKHPELMDKETLYDLRNLVALYPYYQTARLLMLKNLYLLHDSSFDEELRRAAVYMTRRENLFDLVEAAHYGLAQEQQTRRPTGSGNGDPAAADARRRRCRLCGLSHGQQCRGRPDTRRSRPADERTDPH